MGCGKSKGAPDEPSCEPEGNDPIEGAEMEGRMEADADTDAGADSDAGVAERRKARQKRRVVEAKRKAEDEREKGDAETAAAELRAKLERERASNASASGAYSWVPSRSDIKSPLKASKEAGGEDERQQALSAMSDWIKGEEEERKIKEAEEAELIRREKAEAEAEAQAEKQRKKEERRKQRELAKVEQLFEAKRLKALEERYGPDYSSEAAFFAALQPDATTAILLSSCVVARADKLTALVLDDSTLNEAGVVTAAHALERATACRLEEISCRSCCVGMAGARAIGRLVAAKVSLSKVSLSYNSIGPDGLLALAEGVKGQREARERQELGEGEEGGGGTRLSGEAKTEDEQEASLPSSRLKGMGDMEFESSATQGQTQLQYIQIIGELEVEGDGGGSGLAQTRVHEAVRRGEGEGEGVGGADVARTVATDTRATPVFAVSVARSLRIDLSHNKTILGRPHSADLSGFDALLSSLRAHGASKSLLLASTGLGHPNVALPCMMKIANWAKEDAGGVEEIDLSDNSIELVECTKLALWMGTETGLKVLDVRGNGLHQRQADSLFGHLSDALLLRADLEPQEVTALAGEEGEDEDALPSDDEESGAGSDGDREEDGGEDGEKEDGGEGIMEEGSAEDEEAEEVVLVRAATPAEVEYASKIKAENSTLARQLSQLNTGLNLKGGESGPLVGHHEAPLHKMGSFWPNENGGVRTRADHRT